MHQHHLIRTAGRYIVLTFLLCPFFTACQTFKAPEIKLPYLLPVHVLKWANNKPTIRIETPCYNQNDIGFTFQKGQMDMYLDTFYLGRAIIDTSFEVAAKKTFMVPVQLQVDIVPMLNHGLKLDSLVVVRVDGEMSGSVMGVSRTIPVHLLEKHTIDLIMTPF
jgi:hypothetical protein